MKILMKLLKIPKLFDKDADLTSNIAVNKLLAPVYFIFIFYYLVFWKKIPLIVPGSLVFGSLFLAILSTLFYIWTSYFYQPDLDVRLNRPGMNTFPFGAILLNSKISFFLIPIQFAIGKTWYYFWQPYAKVCTHRGVSHWPFISVWYRAAYILLWMFLIKTSLSFFNIEHPILIPTIEYWAKSFFPTEKSFGSITWFCFCFPVFISDLAHEFIDALDSKRKGISFCPPQLPRGLFIQAFLAIRAFLPKKKTQKF